MKSKIANETGKENDPERFRSNLYISIKLSCMKRLLLMLLIVATACNEEEVQYTGSLVVYWNQPTVNGSPLNQHKVGIFDMTSLANYRFLESEAIELKTLDSRVDFTDLNPGNYVIALTALVEHRKVGQVKVGKQTTIILQE